MEIKIVEFKRMVDPVSFTPFIRLTAELPLSITVDGNTISEQNEMLGRSIRKAVEKYLKDLPNATQ